MQSSYFLNTEIPFYDDLVTRACNESIDAYPKEYYQFMDIGVTNSLGLVYRHIKAFGMHEYDLLLDSLIEKGFIEISRKIKGFDHVFRHSSNI